MSKRAVSSAAGGGTVDQQRDMLSMPLMYGAANAGITSFSSSALDKNVSKTFAYDLSKRFIVAGSAMDMQNDQSLGNLT